MHIFNKNERILSQWEAQSCNNGEIDEFVPDGIMFRGQIRQCADGCEHLPSKGFEKEAETWEKAPMRFLFITKELNSYGGDAWEVRKEVGGRKSVDDCQFHGCFHTNLLSQLYGLGNTTPKFEVRWEDVEVERSTFNKSVYDFYDNCALARINVKKQVGEERTDPAVLRVYMEKYKVFLQKQILNLDADIIVCCGSSKKDGNPILDFLIDNCPCYSDLKKVNSWIYYSEKKNIIAIDSWHLSYFAVTRENFYSDMIEAYYEFLQLHPDFVKPHR